MRKKKRNILFLCDNIWDMGEKKGFSAVARIIEAGAMCFDITVFTYDKNRNSDDIYIVFHRIEVQIKNRIVQYVVNIANYILTTVKYFLYGVKLAQKPDLIYISTSMPSLAGFFLGKYYGVPVVQRIYGTFLMSKLTSWYELLKSHQEVLSFYLPANRYIITNDGTYGDKVADFFSIPKRKILFIRNGVTKLDVTSKNMCQTAIRKQYGIKENGIIILSVSRLVFWKRVDRSIAAINQINDKKIYFFIIGDGEENTRYRNMTQNTNIIFLGAKTNQEVAQFMLASDIFLSMYDISNLGNPLLEAMAAGLAIITLDVGNTREVFDGNNMILLPFDGDMNIIENLYNNIVRLANNAEIRKALQYSAKHYADKNILDWDMRIKIELLELEKLMNKDNS